MKLSMAREIWAEILAHARDERPHEACGILFGSGAAVSHIIRSVNVADDPLRHFEIDPAQLISAEREMREGGAEILGYYHSHPGGDLTPSRTDAEAAAADGRIWLITDGERAAAWKAVENGSIFGRFDPISLD